MGGMRLKGVRARYGARALRAAARAIDYGVAYDPRKRRLGHVQYETPWKVVEPRQEVCMSPLQTPQQRAVYESVLLLRICVDGADVKGVKWGLENV